MNDPHIASAFDRDLEALQANIMKMGGLVEASILESTRALAERDIELAETVRAGDRLALGSGHCLEFIPVPTPRWPDGLCTYDAGTQILYSDKLFGAHICSETLWDENWRQLEGDRRYYFDCLQALQSRQVETALDRFESLTLQCLAPGHGPLVRYSLSRLRQDYRQWCQQQAQRSLRVALLYTSAYGNTAKVADAIAKGLMTADVAVESINCESTPPETIAQQIKACDGFIIGSPTLGGHAPMQIQAALGCILANVDRKSTRLNSSHVRTSRMPSSA